MKLANVIIGVGAVMAAFVAVTQPFGAMPSARAVAFQAEPVPVSSASPLPSLSQGAGQ